MEQQTFFLRRLLSLVDGIFAFAMTLLVVNFGYLSATADKTIPVATLLSLNIADFRAYLISFFLLANFWITHNNCFEHIQNSDVGLVWIDLLLLMAISIIPYSTSLIGNQPLDTGAQLFFAANVFFIGLMFLWFWTHAIKKRLIDPGLDPKHATMVKQLLAGICGAVVLAAAIGMVNPHIGPFVYLLIPAGYIYVRNLRTGKAWDKRRNNT